jgi:undecaprenyl pyrophosphate phosphatase UppP
MGFSTELFFYAGAIMAFGVVLWGAVTKHRSVFIAAVAVLPAGLATLLSWYSYAESGSIPWMIGYAIVAVISAYVVVRHLIGTIPKQRE